jgi:type VI secretion system FHA domain protein
MNTSDPAMPLKLKIISENSNLAGDDAVREFHESGGTIGRSLRSNWILPDPDRFISSKHATIDFQGGTYYLADTSTNGVYINDEVDPLGKGNPRRLFDGDRLRMGDFKMEVSVDSGESLVVPMDEKPSVAPDSIEQFVDEDSLRSGMKLLDEEELTGDAEFRSALFGVALEEPEQEAEPPLGDPIPLHKPIKHVRSKATDKPVDVTAEDLFDSFLDGLGISRVELRPSVNRPEMLLTAGQVLRQFVKGTTDLLANRANLKNTFRLDQTTVLPRQNNPMKFSVDTNELLKQLLVGGGGEYLSAQDSIREACNDLINHQNAFLDAMNSAFIEFADRFEPEELQDGFDRTVRSSMFGFMNKAKYWQLYCELYPVMTEKGGGRFPQMFAEEFVKAYERQITEYRRHDHAGTGVKKSPQTNDQPIDEDSMKTRVLEPSVVPDKSDFDDNDIVDALSQTGATEIDHSFIEELEISLAEDVPHDQRKA